MNPCLPGSLSTMAGEIKILMFDDFIRKIITHRALPPIVKIYSYTALTPPSPYLIRFFHTLERLELCSDTEYQNFVYIKRDVNLTSLDTEKLQQQVMGQMKDSGIETVSGHNLPDLIERASVDILENFGLPQYMVPLSHRKYALIDPDSGCLELCKTPDSRVGALVIYTPMKVRILELKEKK